MELAYRFEVEFEHEINANCQMDWMFLLTLSVFSDKAWELEERRRKLSEVCSLLCFKINEENEDKEEEQEEQEEQEQEGKTEEQFGLAVSLKTEKNEEKRHIQSDYFLLAQKKKPGNFQLGFNVGKTGRPRRLSSKIGR
ncbi:hypothetical protein HZH66_007208 [Vespula vulgaris]|uniref:Uncharacterized protein n=1 Tax=Vespula vulgaris TaxID=7454 RepID=A0A834K302_VESVU|nr:hypothetical protein HZH66_007208 [Vespula vulgaris]